MTASSATADRPVRRFVAGFVSNVPLLMLFGTWLVLRVLGLVGVQTLDSTPACLRWALTVMFVVTGLAHFGRQRAEMIAMVPPRLPRPALLVTVTGVLELLGAAGLALPSTTGAAALCLTALLIAMFPANVYAARAALTLGGRQVAGIGPRTLAQLIFIGSCSAVAVAAMS
jgi:uncharacterized membrane protein